MESNSRPKRVTRQSNGGSAVSHANDSSKSKRKSQPKLQSKSKVKTKSPSPAKVVKRKKKGANSAAAALTATDKKLHRAEMLLNISREVAGIETLDEVLKKLVTITSRETKSQRATLFLNDDQTGELYSRVAQGEITHEIRLLNTSGIAGHVFTTGEGLIIDDAYSDVRFNRTVDRQTGFETKTVMCAPVRTVKGEIIGVAQALNKDGGKYNPDDLSLLEAMTSQAAIALQSTQFVERMKKSRATELEFLDVVADVTSEIDLTVLLQKVMGEATRMLKADRSTLFLNDEKSNELWSQVGEGLSAIQIRLPNHLGIAGNVFTSGTTINIPYAYADLRFNPAFDKKTGYFTRSILCVPVINKAGKVIGVTQVLNKRGGPFNEEDESRLKAFTGQVSIALENAKLFDDVQNMKNYNESMLESMTNAVITTNEDGLIITCNKAGFRIMKIGQADIIDKSVEEYFTGANKFVAEKIKEVEESNITDEMVDAEVEFDGEKISVNATFLPLVSSEDKKLGAMLMLEDISSEKRMKSTMSRYMDPAIAAQLMGSGKQDDILGGKSAMATIMFTDIRGFTPITESLGAQGTVGFLNDYFTLMVEEISKEEGMLDKFIGDAIMAAFGLPIAHDDDEDRAVRASIAMIKSLWEWNVEREAIGQLPADMGIGLNTDEVVSGNIGSPKRMNYTLIGDGVNLAARLESACKQYGARILLSSNTVEKLKGTYRIRDIDEVVVIGKTEPARVYECLDYHTDETFPNLMDVVNYFKEGRKHYIAGDWDKAVKSFEECLKGNEKDKLSNVYIDRCKTLKAKPPKNWDGVWTMTSK
jgi:adenylate cyclase